MRKIIYQMIVLIFISGLANAQALENLPEYSKAGFFTIPNSWREVLDFNVGWRFFKGAQDGAEQYNFDDSKWNIVNTPHGLELVAAMASGSNNYQGEAWYRKHFTVPDSLLNKRLIIYFEAVMGKCKVWLNGELLTTLVKEIILSENKKKIEVAMLVLFLFIMN